MTPRGRQGRAAAALGGGVVGLVLVTLSAGPARLVQGLLAAGWVLPFLLAVHAAQLLLSALAWRQCLGKCCLTMKRLFLARWVREGVNSLLPTAQLGGQIASVGILIRCGVGAPRTVASAILDLTIEAVAQFVVTLAALAVLLGARGGGHRLALVAGGVFLTGAIAISLMLAQHFRIGRRIEQAMERAARRWPKLDSWSLSGLDGILAERVADRPALVRAGVLQIAAWSLGAGEVWIALRALGHAVGPGGAFVIEALGMAARSAGFAVPGAVGVQEGGFVLVCALYGVPAGAALSLSVLKRARELAVGLPALWVWHRQTVKPVTAGQV